MNFRIALSNLTRGFSEKKFFKIYFSAKKHKGLIKEIQTFRYMRIATKEGGYIGRTTTIEGEINLPHGLHGIHISRLAKIGKNCTILQNVTIGAAKGKAPVIGNNVLIGANACVIGDITIGNNVNIGAGSVVTKNLPDNCTAVGSPIFRILE